MTKAGIVRTIGWVQMVVSIILAMAITATYFVYRTSLADYSRALAESILSVSNVLTITAERITARQDLLQDAQNALKSTRDVVEVLKRSVETHGKNIPQYSADLKQAAAVAGKVGNTLTEVGKGLMFKVPTNLEWHPPYRPVIAWTMPLEAQANALKAHGQSINELSGTLTAMANSLETDVPKVNAVLIDMSQKTLELLRDMEGVAAKLGSQVLPQAIEVLKATSQKLHQAGELANRAEYLGLALFVIGLGLALLSALNGWAMLLLAPRQANGG